MHFHEIRAQHAVAEDAARPAGVLRSITPPPEYQAFDPLLVQAPVRPKRPASLPTLEDIFAMYSEATETFYPLSPTPTPCRQIHSISRVLPFSPAKTLFRLSNARKPLDRWACQYTFRACAFLTARKLSSALRSPSAELEALLQPKPLTWTDAAEPLLSWMRQFRGITVLDSQFPCTVPHIVISEPTTDGDWAAWENAIPEQCSDDGKLLSLTWIPRAPEYYTAYDEEWYTSEDMGSEFLDDLDINFDDDEFSLPSPEFVDFVDTPPAPVTPPPNYIDTWRVGATNSEKNASELSEMTTLSPTSGPGLPMVFVHGGVSFSSYEFPCSIEHDNPFSPVSPTDGARAAGFNDWNRSIASVIMV